MDDYKQASLLSRAACCKLHSLCSGFAHLCESIRLYSRVSTIHSPKCYSHN